MDQENQQQGLRKMGAEKLRSLSDHQPALIVVTGIMGAGKSTIARLLAQRFVRGVHVEADVLQQMIVSGGVWVSQPGELEGEAMLGQSILTMRFVQRWPELDSGLIPRSRRQRKPLNRFSKASERRQRRTHCYFVEACGLLCVSARTV